MSYARPRLVLIGEAAPSTPSTPSKSRTVLVGAAVGAVAIHLLDTKHRIGPVLGLTAALLAVWSAIDPPSSTP